MGDRMYPFLSVLSLIENSIEIITDDLTSVHDTFERFILRC